MKRIVKRRRLGPAAGCLFVLACAGTAQAAPNEPVLALDCGSSSAVGWYAADAAYSGGASDTMPKTIGTTPTAIDTAQAYYPAPAAVYRTVRTGDSTYTLAGLKPSTRYQVRLHFADAESTAVGQRKLDVTIADRPVLTSYDIFADVGHANAVVKTFNATADAYGKLVVKVRGVVGSAVIAGIDVLPGFAYFIDAGGTGAPKGSYQVDELMSDGTVYVNKQPIATHLVHSPPPQAVYQSVRQNAAGNVTYVLPNLAPRARYDVRLHFAELDSGHGYAGARVFDVSLNGKRVLHRYDPFAAGNGLYVATSRQFEVAADDTGKITLLLSRVTSNPIINAIEVRPQISFMFNAGGSATSGYDADRSGYLDPTASLGSSLTTTTTVAQPQPGFVPIAYGPPSVYRSARAAPYLGTLRYALAGLIPDKLYHVKLHFAEIEPGVDAGERVFTVKINGQRILPHFDVAVAAKATYTALVREVTYSADAQGRLVLSFEGETAAGVSRGPLVNAIEVGSEAPGLGYTATDVGMQNRFGGGFIASTVFGVDGGCSARVGDNVLWAYGDTLFDDPDLSYAAGWNNSGALGARSDPLNVIEVTDVHGEPTGQLVPLRADQLAYNQKHHSAYGCTGTCDGSYYAIWPGSIIRQADTSGLIFAGVAMIFGLPASPKGEGVITYVQQPGAWATNPTLPAGVQHGTLFPARERSFTRGFLAQDGYVYLYRAEGGTTAKLRSALTFGQVIRSVPLELATVKADGTLEEANGLADAAMAGEQLELVSPDGAHRQVVTVATSLAPGAYVDPRIEIQPIVVNYAYPADSTIQRLGAPIGQLGSTLRAGVSASTVTLAQPLPIALRAGQTFQFWTYDNYYGLQWVLVVKATADAAKGTKAISVEPFTPQVDYAPGARVHQSVVGPWWSATYIARAKLADAANRDAYRFWNQWNAAAGDYSGAWDTNIANGTPMLYSDGSIGWMDAPSMAWNPYLKSYLVVRALMINDGVYVAQTSTPQGPWPPETRVTRVHTHESYAGAYFMNQHPELDLSNGQTIHVTYATSGAGPSDYTGGVRVLRLTLP